MLVFFSYIKVFIAATPGLIGLPLILQMEAAVAVFGILPLTLHCPQIINAFAFHRYDILITLVILVHLPYLTLRIRPNADSHMVTEGPQFNHHIHCSYLSFRTFDMEHNSYSATHCASLVSPWPHISILLFTIFPLYVSLFPSLTLHLIYMLLTDPSSVSIIYDNTGQKVQLFFSMTYMSLSTSNVLYLSALCSVVTKIHTNQLFSSNLHLHSSNRHLHAHLRRGYLVLHFTMNMNASHFHHLRTLSVMYRLHPQACLHWKWNIGALQRLTIWRWIVCRSLGCAKNPPWWYWYLDLSGHCLL